jgi:hypothetical protein
LQPCESKIDNAEQVKPWATGDIASMGSTMCRYERCHSDVVYCAQTAAS